MIRLTCVRRTSYTESAVETRCKSWTGRMPTAAEHAGMDRCVVLSRGFNYATALEIALKMKELAYVTTVPYSYAGWSGTRVTLPFPTVVTSTVWASTANVAV